MVGDSVILIVCHIADEPEDGPSLYFFLVDLGTKGILNSFFECGLHVDAIFRLYDVIISSKTFLICGVS
jgi:hypothetical protein